MLPVHAGEVEAHGRWLVVGGWWLVHNGYHAEREVTTAAGAVGGGSPVTNKCRSGQRRPTQRIVPVL
jgi:hypothetical protein